MIVQDLTNDDLVSYIEEPPKGYHYFGQTPSLYQDDEVMRSTELLLVRKTGTKITQEDRLMCETIWLKMGGYFG